MEHIHLAGTALLPAPPSAPTLRPAVPACSDLEVPLGKKSTASAACHPVSSQGADSRQTTRQLEDGAGDRAEVERGK